MTVRQLCSEAQKERTDAEHRDHVKGKVIAPIELWEFVWHRG